MPARSHPRSDIDVDVIREMVDGMKEVWEGVVKGTWRQFAAMQRDGWPKKLGYSSFEEFAQAEFGGVLMVPRAERQEAVAELTAPIEQGGFGLTNVKAAEVLGIDETTVRRDRASAFAERTDGSGSEFSLYGSANAEAREAVSVELLDRTEKLSEYEREKWVRLRRGEIIVVNMRTDSALIDLAMQRGRYVRIDRRTEWGNPFEMPADGDREAVIASYEHHYLPFKPSLTARLDELYGMALGCWCAPDACHGDILKKFAEGERDDA